MTFSAFGGGNFTFEYAYAVHIRKLGLPYVMVSPSFPQYIRSLATGKKTSTL